MASNKRIIEIIEVDPDPNKGGFYRYKCKWDNEDGDSKTAFVSCREGGLRVGRKYTCEMKVSENKGYKNLTISNVQPLSEASEKNATANTEAKATPASSVPAKREAQLVIEFVGKVREGLDGQGDDAPTPPAIIDTVLIELFRRGVCQRYVAENAEAEAAGMPGGDIPF